MTPTLSCPHAEYRDGMRIYSNKADAYCGNQYFKTCKGWWALTDKAGRCPVRKDDQNETTPNGGD